MAHTRIIVVVEVEDIGETHTQLLIFLVFICIIHTQKREYFFSVSLIHEERIFFVVPR